MILDVPLTGWTLRVDPDGPTRPPAAARALAGRTIPALVPGAVHGDLLAAGLIPDPFVDDNELAVAWVSRTDWMYECSIGTVPDAERIDVVFDGIDTVARIAVDGVEVGRSRNMHRSYRFDATGVLAGPGAGQPGHPRHRLTVGLTSAYTKAESIRARIGPRPSAYPEPFNLIRKMACSFGWDWGPTVVGAGLWRPVRLQAWSCARIAGVRALAEMSDVPGGAGGVGSAGGAGGAGLLRVLLEVERTGSGIGAPLQVEVLLDGTPVAARDLGPGCCSAELWVGIPDVRVWHPVGYGAPALYRLEIRLTGPAGELLDVDEREIGFRALELDRSADDAGTRFLFRLNGQPLLVKGVNWIPGDVLPGRMTRDRYELRLRQAVDACVNLIRVWGGGVYESDEFYDVCDHLGLLVWQDFPFACAAYPEEEPLRGEILAEAAANVARLSSHPSLVLWNGNNENLWLHGAERWAEQPGGELPWGTRYYLEDLPRIVADLDPSRPYTAGSPWSGSWEHDPNDPHHQTFHSWDVWNRQDYTHYRDSAPRFVAEFGWQAPAAWRTLRDAVTDEPMTPTSPGLAHHQKAAGGMDKLRRGLAPHASVPEDFDAWHYLMQWNQVRAVEAGVLHWRSHWPATAGMILWQLNDIWPALSWSAIDGAGRPKPLYHALREMYAPRALSIQPDGDDLLLCVLNDHPDAWIGEALLRRVGDGGSVRDAAPVPVCVPPRSAARLPVPHDLAVSGDPAAEVFVAEMDRCRTLGYFREPKDCAFAGEPPEVSVTPTPGGLEIGVTATTLLRDFLVQPDRMHPAATADRGFLTILPGESATVTVSCPESLPPETASTPFAMAWLDRVIGR